MKYTTIFLMTLAAAGAYGQANQDNGGWRRFDPDPQSAAAAPTAAPTPAPGPAAVNPSTLTLPAGTWVKVRVNELLTTDRNRQGDTFTATLSQPLIAQGYVVARHGQTIGGRVSVSEKGGVVKGVSHLGLELTDVTLVDGQQAPLHTELMQYSAGSSVGRDTAAVGVTTGTGAAIGAAVNGGVGAGVGAGIGLVASTIGVLSTRGRSTVVYPEDTITFRLANPVTINTDAARFAFEPAKQTDYESRPAIAPRPAVVARPPYYGGYGAPYPYPYPYPYFYGPAVIVGGRFGPRW